MDEDLMEFSYMAEAVTVPQKEYFKGKKSQERIVKTKNVIRHSKVKVSAKK